MRNTSLAIVNSKFITHLAIEGFLAFRAYSHSLQVAANACSGRHGQRRDTTRQPLGVKHRLSIKMAYAIYFFKDKSVEVGKIEWMYTGDQKKTCSKNITQCPNLEDEDGWMSVKWGKKTKDGPTFFPAKVLMLGGKSCSLKLYDLMCPITSLIECNVSQG